ncbi:MAG: hypothetical protein JNK67_09715 [Alphaproteobacteria bacterium]|nr:hypothetical protein [Alphaproteobacteria bacterium]
MRASRRTRGGGVTGPALSVERVDRSAEPVLRALFQLYIHDMSAWFDVEPGPDGRFAYPIETLWSGAGDVYLARRGAIPVGFGLVGAPPPGSAPPDTRDLQEFFVLRRHRRAGIGGRLATAIWSDRPGPWLVRALHDNLPAVPFWRRTIAAYTRGAYREESRDVAGRRWCHFTFDAAP